MARNAVYDRFDSRTVRTNFARQTNLLPDGTHIWLNAGSVLRDYGDLTGRRRVVELDGATASTACALRANRFGRVLALVHRRYLCDEVGVAR